MGHPVRAGGARDGSGSRRRGTGACKGDGWEQEGGGWAEILVGCAVPGTHPTSPRVE